MTDEPTRPLSVGDPIWFRQTCLGGYGFQRDVPGEFVRYTPRGRTTVSLRLKDGSRRQISVLARNVRRRP